MSSQSRHKRRRWGTTKDSSSSPSYSSSPDNSSEEESAINRFGQKISIKKNKKGHGHGRPYKMVAAKPVSHGQEVKLAEDNSVYSSSSSSSSSEYESSEYESSSDSAFASKVSHERTPNKNKKRRRGHGRPRKKNRDKSDNYNDDNDDEEEEKDKDKTPLTPTHELPSHFGVPLKPRGGQSKSFQFTTDEKYVKEVLWRAKVEFSTSAQDDNGGGDSGKVCTYAKNAICHICHLRKDHCAIFPCGNRKHAYCEYHCAKRLGFHAIDAKTKSTKIDHCPICCLSCICTKCSRHLDAVSTCFQNESKKQKKDSLEEVDMKVLRLCASKNLADIESEMNVDRIDQYLSSNCKQDDADEKEREDTGTRDQPIELIDDENIGDDSNKFIILSSSEDDDDNPLHNTVENERDSKKESRVKDTSPVVANTEIVSPPPTVKLCTPLPLTANKIQSSIDTFVGRIPGKETFSSPNIVATAANGISYDDKNQDDHDDGSQKAESDTLQPTKLFAQKASSLSKRVLNESNENDNGTLASQSQRINDDIMYRDTQSMSEDGNQEEEEEEEENIEIEQEHKQTQIQTQRSKPICASSHETPSLIVLHQLLHKLVHPIIQKLYQHKLLSSDDMSALTPIFLTAIQSILSQPQPPAKTTPPLDTITIQKNSKRKKKTVISEKASSISSPKRKSRAKTQHIRQKPPQLPTRRNLKTIKDTAIKDSSNDYSSSDTESYCSSADEHIYGEYVDGEPLHCCARVPKVKNKKPASSQSQQKEKQEDNDISSHLSKRPFEADDLWSTANSVTKPTMSSKCPFSYQDLKQSCRDKTGKVESSSLSMSSIQYDELKRVDSDEDVSENQGRIIDHDDCSMGSQVSNQGNIEKKIQKLYCDDEYMREEASEKIIEASKAEVLPVDHHDESSIRSDDEMHAIISVQESTSSSSRSSSSKHNPPEKPLSAYIDDFASNFLRQAIELLKSKLEWKDSFQNPPSIPQAPLRIQVVGDFWWFYACELKKLSDLIEHTQKSIFDEANEGHQSLNTIAKLILCLNVVGEALLRYELPSSKEKESSSSTTSVSPLCVWELVLGCWRDKRELDEFGIIRQIGRIVTHEQILIERMNNNDSYCGGEGRIDVIMGKNFGLHALYALCQNIYSDARKKMEKQLSQDEDSYTSKRMTSARSKHNRASDSIFKNQFSLENCVLCMDSSDIYECDYCGRCYHEKCLPSEETESLNEDRELLWLCQRCETGKKLLLATEANDLNLMQDLLVTKGASPLGPVPVPSEHSGILISTPLHISVQQNSYEATSMLLCGAFSLLNEDASRSLLQKKIPERCWGRDKSPNQDNGGKNPFDRGVHISTKCLDQVAPIESLLLLCFRGCGDIRQVCKLPYQRHMHKLAEVDMDALMDYKISQCILPQDDISSGLEPVKIPWINDTSDGESLSNFTYISRPVESPSCGKFCHQWQPKKCLSPCAEISIHDSAHAQRMDLVPCGNHVNFGGVRFQFEVFRAFNGRWGVRTAKNKTIQKGSILFSYAGLVSQNSGTKDLMDDGPVLCVGSTETSEHDASFSIDARKFRNIAAFINRISGDANVEASKSLSSRLGPGFPSIVYRAKENIPPLTELTWNNKEKLHNCVCSLCFREMHGQ